MSWSVDLLRVAEAQADRGDFAWAGKFCDALFGDDRFSSVARTRVHALLGQPVRFEASGDGRRRGRVTRALETDEDWWTIAPTQELANIKAWALAIGFCPVNFRWVKQNGRDIPRMRFWHPSLSRYDGDRDVWSVNTTKGWVDIKPGNGEWGLYTPFGKDRPWIHGLWRGCARWYLLKQYAIDDWGRHSETAALRVAFRTDVGDEGYNSSNKEARAELANDLYDLGRDSAIVLPDGYDLKIVEATANTRDIYDAQITTANTSYAVAWLGHNLTSEVGGAGSYAASKTGQMVREDLSRFDDMMLGEWAHDDALVPYAAVNFGDPALASWPTWQPEAQPVSKDESDVFLTAAEAVKTFAEAGAPVDLRKFLTAFGVPLLPEGAKPAAMPVAAPVAAPDGDDDTEN
jgi:hypothetical protein